MTATISASEKLKQSIAALSEEMFNILPKVDDTERYEEDRDKLNMDSLSRLLTGGDTCASILECRNDGVAELWLSNNKANKQG